MRVRCVTLLAGGELTAGRSAGTGLRGQYLPGGDVLHDGLRGQWLALRSVAAAGGGDHRQPHFASPAGNPCRADVEHGFRAAIVLMLGVSLSGIEDVGAGRVGKRPQPAAAEFSGC